MTTTAAAAPWRPGSAAAALPTTRWARLAACRCRFAPHHPTRRARAPSTAAGAAAAAWDASPLCRPHRALVLARARTHARPRRDRRTPRPSPTRPGHPRHAPATLSHARAAQLMLQPDSPRPADGNDDDDSRDPARRALTPAHSALGALGGAPPTLDSLASAPLALYVATTQGSQDSAYGDERGGGDDDGAWGGDGGGGGAWGGDGGGG
eukprot:1436747-Prymnesium_polylepis.1